MADSIIDPTMPKLTHRERFRRLMHFQTVDRVVHWEFGYLAGTHERWHREGLPADRQGDGEVEGYFGVDPRTGAGTLTGLLPGFEGETKILEEGDGKRIEEYPDGMICEVKTEGIQTIPRYIKMPIANRDDWKRFKERLDPDSPERHQADFRKIGQELRESDLPVGIGLGSFFGVVRGWIGFEQLALMCYDDRKLVEEIIETLTDLTLSQLRLALREVEVDFAGGWEDICFRNGPMISPAMFKDLVLPHVRRVCDLLREHGCDIIWTDCDGDISDLVPLWLDAGLNCMFPLEVHAGSDPVKYREQYGRRILLIGGLAKYQFAHSKKEILAELKRVEHLVHDGGYIPHGDHRIPQDVSYENYRYYVREKLALLGWKEEDVAEIEPLKGVKSEHTWR